MVSLKLDWPVRVLIFSILSHVGADTEISGRVFNFLVKNGPTAVPGKNCRAEKEIYRNRFYRNTAGKQIFSNCLTPATYKIICDEQTLTVVQQGTLPVKIEPNYLHFVGIRHHNITCRFSKKESFQTLRFYSLDYSNLLKIHGNTLYPHQEVGDVFTAIYKCGIDEDTPVKIRKFHIYPEPRIKFTQAGYFTYLREAKIYADVTWSVRYTPNFFFAFMNLQDTDKFYPTERLVVHNEHYLVGVYFLQAGDYESFGLMQHWSTNNRRNSLLLPIEKVNSSMVITTPPGDFHSVQNQPESYVCKFKGQQLSTFGLSWRHKWGPRVFQGRTYRLLQRHVDTVSDTVCYECVYQEKLVVATRIFKLFSPEPLKLMPDALNVSNLNVRNFTCTQGNQPSIISWINITGPQSDVYLLQGNRLILKTVLHAQFKLNCVILGTDFKSTALLNLYAPYEVVINPPITDLYGVNLPNITCGVSPADQVRGAIIYWKHTGLGRTHRIRKESRSILERKIYVVDTDAEYTCFVKLWDGIKKKVHRIRIIYSISTVVITNSNVQYVGHTFKLTCKLIPDITPLRSDVNWTYFLTELDESKKRPSFLDIVQKKTNVVSFDFSHDKPIKVQFTCYSRYGNEMPTVVSIYSIPKLGLRDISALNYIVHPDNFAECYAVSETMSTFFVGSTYFVPNRKYPEAIISGFHLVFTNPPEGKKKIPIQCVYHHGELKLKETFTFTVYSLTNIMVGSDKNAKPVLKPEEDCEATCGTNVTDLNDLQGFNSSYTDLVIAAPLGSMDAIKVIINGGKLWCAKVRPTKWFCFAVTCNVQIKSFRLKSTRSRRCYGGTATARITGKEYATVKGSTLTIESEGIPSHLTRYVWTVKYDNKKIRTTSAGSFGIVPYGVAKSVISMTCDVYFAPSIDGSLSISQTAELTLADPQLVKLEHDGNGWLVPKLKARCHSPDPTKTATIQSSFINNLEKIRLHEKKIALFPKNLRSSSFFLKCTVDTSSVDTSIIVALPVLVDRTVLQLSKSTIIFGESFRCFANGVGAKNFKYKILGLHKDKHYAKYCPFSDETTGTITYDTICRAGVQKLRCSITGEVDEILATKDFRIEVVGYDPLFNTDEIFRTKMDWKVVLFWGIIWFLILIMNAVVFSYLVNFLSLPRLIVLCFMSKHKTGGTRPALRSETMPSVYVERTEIDGQFFRRLRLATAYYESFLESGKQWFFIWNLNQQEARVRLLNILRQLLFLERSKSVVRMGRKSTYVPSMYMRKSVTYGKQSVYTTQQSQIMRRKTMKR